MRQFLFSAWELHLPGALEPPGRTMDRLAVRARPDGLPIMRQTWSDLLFLHWRVDPAQLRPHVPSGLEIDTFDGSAWIGVTPFRITGIRPVFLPPVPFLSTSLELNVRTYVVHRETPGVWFFSLDADNPLAVPAAKLTYRLPYRHARMSMQEVSGGIRFRSRRSEGEAPHPGLSVEWRRQDALAPPAPDSLEFFLVERYCLFARHHQALYRAWIHHPPWALRRAEVTALESTMLSAQGLPASPEPQHSLAQSGSLDVEIWPLERVGTT